MKIYSVVLKIILEEQNLSKSLNFYVFPCIRNTGSVEFFRGGNSLLSSIGAKSEQYPITIYYFDDIFYLKLDLFKACICLTTSSPPLERGYRKRDPDVRLPVFLLQS